MRGVVARRVVLACALSASVLVAGCGMLPTSAGPPLGSGNSGPASSQSVSAINGFGLKLLRATERSTLANSPNTVISPLSVHIALGMASDAAEGQTRDEMRGVMGISDAQDADYHATLAAIWSGNKGQLQLADSIWTQSGYPVRSAYTDLMRTQYSAEASSADFSTMAGPNAVNAWVSAHTNGVIPEVMSGPDPALRVMLVNTAHFLAKWRTPFELRETKPSPFHLASGQTVRVPTMHLFSTFAETDLGDSDVLELPYDGDRASMLVFLPKPGVTLDSMLASMTAGRVALAEKSLAATDTWGISVALPKYKATWGADLVGPLEAMGVKRAFDPAAADLSAMSPDRPLWFATVAHKTYLDVNEHTTEAAAATGFTAHGGYNTTRPTEFIVDRPYLMALVDKPTGALLFLAAIRDPRVSAAH